jgi:zinc transport system ATP-binding protein
MDKVIDVKNLKFGYNDVIVLEGVSFFVEKGDYFGIIGPNGSAKSTLIKLLLGILKPLEGEINILGQKVEKFNQWGEIGYISQKGANINNSFPATVQEVVGSNLYSRAKVRKFSKKAYREEVDNVLEIVGMQDYRNRLVGNLSGGQQQRVFIARVLISKPELMFLDEPMTGIDTASEDAVYCLLAKLNRDMGITVVMVTHDIGAITTHANKLGIMGNKGLTVCEPKEDSVSEILNSLYGYSINLNMKKHDCNNCSWRNIV